MPTRRGSKNKDADTTQRRRELAYERAFEVSPSAIANLTSTEFVAFVTHLLRAEIARYGGAPEDLLGNFAPGPDGGRDATTRRSASVTMSDDTLIPFGETVWQCKEGALRKAVERGQVPCQRVGNRLRFRRMDLLSKSVGSRPGRAALTDRR